MGVYAEPRDLTGSHQAWFVVWRVLLGFAGLWSDPIFLTAVVLMDEKTVIM